MPRKKTVTDANLLTAALAGLEVQKQRVEEQIARVRSMLGGRKSKLATGKAVVKSGGKRRLSAKARKRISEAQKRRWDEFRERKAAAR